MLTPRIAGHVKSWSQPHGGVLLLDTAASLWLELNPTAGEYWRIWESGAESDDGVAAVAARHPDLPREEIRADAERLIAELLDRRLIIPREEIRADAERLIAEPLDRRPIIPAPSAGHGAVAVMAVPDSDPPGQRPGAVRTAMAFLMLAVAAVLLRYPVRVSCALVRATRHGWCRAAPRRGQVMLTASAVSRAARYFPGRAACLEQSLAAVLIAATARKRLDWCLGSAPDPYRFHAWVEVAGQSVLTTGDIATQPGYTRVLSV